MNNHALKTLLAMLLLTISSPACHRVTFNTPLDSQRKEAHVEQQTFALFGAVPLTEPLSFKCKYGLGYVKTETPFKDIFLSMLVMSLGGLSSYFISSHCDDPTSASCLATSSGVGLLISGSVRRSL